MDKNNPEQVVFGNSPLGGNSVEGTNSGDDMAAVKTTAIQGVPLFYDYRVDTFISELAIQELDDRDISLQKADVFNKEEEFRMKAGYKKQVSS